MIGKAVVKFASDFAYAFNINFTFVSEGDMKQASKTDGVPLLFLLKCLLFAYALTGALLMLLSLLLFKAGLGEKTVSVAIIVIYVSSTFVAGFLAGKKMKNRKFVWGLLEGISYFLILAVISFAAGEDAVTSGNSFFTTLVLCSGGGMLGGMLS